MTVSIFFSYLKSIWLFGAGLMFPSWYNSSLSLTLSSGSDHLAYHNLSNLRACSFCPLNGNMVQGNSSCWASYISLVAERDICELLVLPRLSLMLLVDKIYIHFVWAITIQSIWIWENSNDLYESQWST